MVEFFKAHWHQIWGLGVAIFGVYYAYRRDISVRIEGGATLFQLKGNVASLFGILIVLLGIAVALNLTQMIKVDKCLDNGGRFDYEKETCILESQNSRNAK